MNTKLTGKALLVALLGMPGIGVQAQQTGAYCCPGRNMIVNGGFEAGNTSFASSYIFQPGFALGSVNPGEYCIMTSAQATMVAANWNPACPADNNHLVINGRTMQTGEQVVWQQTVMLNKGVSYKFCSRFKNLPQCSFDIKPKVSIRFSVPGMDVNNVTINVGNTGCAWQQIQQTLFVGGSGTIPVTISIYLNEIGNGDGNDLAIDNLFLVAIPQVPASDVIFSVTPFNTSGGTTNIEANPVVPISAGCYFYWDVTEVDNNNDPVPGTLVVNPSAWFILPCRFWGYVGTGVLGPLTNAGVFQLNKRYRIAYGRWCDCQTWNASAVILEWTRGSLVARVDSNYVADPGMVSQMRPGGTDLETPLSSALSPLTAGKDILNATTRVFPNPTNNKVTVLLSPCKEESRLELLSAAGKVLQRFTIQASETRMELSLERYAAGIYLLQHKDRSGTLLLNEKVVRQ